MDDRELKELENGEEWDDASAELHQPARKARAVVSIAFPREAFDSVSAAAAEQGLKLSEFIRNAAITEAHEHRRYVEPFSVSDSQGGFQRGTFTVNDIRGYKVQVTTPGQEIETLATT